MDRLRGREVRGVGVEAGRTLRKLLQESHSPTVRQSGSEVEEDQGGKKLQDSTYILKVKPILFVNLK